MVPRYLEFRNLGVVIHIVECFLFNWDIMILKRGGRRKGVGEVEAGERREEKLYMLCLMKLPFLKVKMSIGNLMNPDIGTYPWVEHVSL